jgi:hypothetical protein
MRNSHIHKQETRVLFDRGNALGNSRKQNIKMHRVNHLLAEAMLPNPPKSSGTILLDPILT